MDDLASDDASKVSNNRPETVLKSRKAICMGYADLFVALCQEAGIEAVKVRGFARVYKGPDGTAQLESHAWNAVKLDGQWKLFDATWGAGTTNGKAFNKNYTEMYFQVAPEQLIFSHFPREEKWQLLDPPITQEVFEKQPKVDTALFRYGITPKAIQTVIKGTKFRELVKVYTMPTGQVTVKKAPLDKYLKAGTSYAFELASLDVVEIIAENNGNVARIQRGPRGFVTSLVPLRGTLKIAGRTSMQDPTYFGIFEYVVE